MTRAASLRTLEGLELEALIGQGGIGEVWRARYRSSGQPVAVKALAADVSSEPGFDADFAEEMAVVAGLNHRGIVRVLDWGRLPAGRAALVMTLCTGGTWAQVRPSDWSQGRRWLLTVLGALSHAHARGILHGDLKPDNVLVHEGDAQLADFGLAARLDLAMVPGPLGSPGYQAPEQARGLRHDLGPWTDLYALGVVAGELLAGLEVPPLVGDWLERLCAPEPRDRYPSAAAAARVLAPRWRAPRHLPAPYAVTGLGVLASRRLPAVGRDTELAAIQQALAQATADRAMVRISLVGAAGAGARHLARHAAAAAAEDGRALALVGDGTPAGVIQVAVGARGAGPFACARAARAFCRRHRCPALEPALQAALARALSPAAQAELLSGIVSAIAQPVVLVLDAPVARAVAAEGPVLLLSLGESGGQRMSLRSLPPAAMAHLSRQLLRLEPALAARLEAEAGGMPGHLVGRVRTLAGTLRWTPDGYGLQQPLPVAAPDWRPRARALLAAGRGGAALAWMHAHAGPPQGSDDLLLRADLCRARGDLSAADRWAAQALAAAQSPASQAGALRARGYLHLARHHLDAAEADLTAAQALAEAAGDRVCVGACLHYRGHIQRLRGDPAAAASLLRAALATAPDDPRERGDMRRTLGVVLDVQGRWQEALAMLALARNDLREAGHQRALGQVLNNMGEVLRRRGQQEEAAAAYQEAIRRIEQTGQRPACEARINLAILSVQQGSADAVEAVLSPIRAYLHDQGERSLLLYLHTILAWAALRQGRSPELHLTQAHQLARRTGIRDPDLADVLARTAALPGAPALAAALAQAQGAASL